MFTIENCPQNEKDSLELAQVYYNFAHQFSRCKNQEFALIYHKKSFAIRKQYLAQQDFLLNKSLWKIGATLEEQAKHDASLDYYQNALTNIEEQTAGKYVLLSARLHRHLAIAYEKNGDYETALPYAEEAIKQFQQLERPFDVAFVLNIMGNIYCALGQPNTAIPKLKKGLSILPPDKLNLHVVLLISLGNAFLIANDLDAALNAYESALKKSTENKDHQLVCLNNIGIIKKRQKKYTEAIHFFQQSIDKQEGQSQAANYDNIGDVYQLQGKYSKAIQSYHKAIQLTVPTLKETDSTQFLELTNFQILGEPANLLTFLTSKANTFTLLHDSSQNQKHLTAAINSFKTADQLVDRMRNEHTENASKLFWRAQVVPMYEQAIKTAFQAGDKEALLHFMEKSKAALLADAWHERASLAQANIPQGISYKIDSLKKALYQDQLNTNQYLTLKRELYRLLGDLEKEFPAYFMAKIEKLTPDLSTIRSFLPNNAALITFAVVGDTIFTIKITQSEFISTQKKLSETFDKIVEEYLPLTHQLRLDTEQENQLTRLSEELYNILLQLILQTNDPEINRLILIPDGVLQPIPFELLVEANGKMVLEKYATTYAYSIAVLQENLKTTTSSSTKLLGMAPVNFSYSNTLNSLTESIDETTEIEALFPGKKFTNKDAKKQAFITNASNAGILLLSTHGGLQDSLHPTSWIAFSDTILYLPELHTLKTNAQMAVISACHTSSGLLQKGEGVMSIARGFSYAGVPSVTAALWEIPEGPTKSLMTTYFSNLKNGLPKDIALQKAKLEVSGGLTKSLQAPGNWAAHRHIGNWQPLKQPKQFNYWWLLMIATGILSWLFYRKNYKH